MQFKLGDIQSVKNIIAQEIYLVGDGFGINRPPKRPRDGILTEGLIMEMTSPIKVNGAVLRVPMGNAPASVLIALRRDYFFEMFASYADIKFTVLDTRAEALRIKLELKPPSNSFK